MLKSVTWLVIGRIISDGLSFVFYIAVARTFGEAGIGNYAFSFAVALLLGICIEFGFRPLITRTIARQPYLASACTGEILTIQFGLTIVAGSLLAGLIYIKDYDFGTKMLLALAFCATALQAIGTSLSACLEAIDAMDKSAILEIAMKGVATTSGFILLLAGAPLHLVMVAHVLGGLVFLGLGAYWVSTGQGIAIRKPDIHSAFNVLRAAFPFLGAAALYLLYTRVDVMMLHYLVGEVETGRYSAAVRLATTPLVFAFLVGLAIYPRLTRAIHANDSHEEVLFLSALKWLGIAGMAGAVTLAVVGDKLVVMLLGQAFVGAGELMIWLSILFFIGFVRVPFERLLLAHNRERLYLYAEGVASVVNIALNLLLIPTWGARGAVWASIVSQMVVLVGFYLWGKRIVAAPYAAQAGRLLLAGASGVAGSTALLWIGPWPISAALAPMVVVATALLLGLITREDWRVWVQARDAGS